MSIFMKIEGIKGESADQNHKGWLDIALLNWGVKRKITSSTSTVNDRESSNAIISDLLITRRMDSATPKLFIDACCGKGKKVIIHMTKTGSGTGADVYMEYTLENALICSYKVAGHTLETKRPLEAIMISFIDLEVKYTPYDEDGTALSPISQGYDTASNKKH